MNASTLVPLVLAAAAGDDPLPPAALRADLELLRSCLAEAHAGYDRYRTRAEMDELFEAVARELDEPRTALELYLLAAPVVDAIGDGHTQLKAPPATYRAANAGRHVPLKLALEGDRAWVLYDLSGGEGPPPGAEVVALHGTPTADVLAAMRALETSDGAVRSDETRKLELALRFSFHLHALFPGRDRIPVAWLDPGTGERRAAELRGRTVAEMQAALARHPTERTWEGEPLSLEHVGDASVLTVRTFAWQRYREREIDFDARVATLIGEVVERAPTGLVLDVRGNGGGTDAHVVALAAHLLDEPFTLYRSVTVRAPRFPCLRDARSSGSLRPLEPVELAGGALPSAGLVELPDGRWSVADHPHLRPVRPRAPRWDGPLVVLLDGRSFSATGELTSLLRQHGRATFVGEEGGAAFGGSTSGVIASRTLPASGLRIDLPLVRYELAVDPLQPVERGLLPDVAVRATVRHRLAGRDPVLARALELFR